MKPTERRWRDLSTVRVCSGLILAPILAYLAYASLVLFIADNSRLCLTLGAMGLAALLWSLCVGNVYLATFVRRRSVTSRTECILLGLGIVVTMPVVCWWVFDLGLIHFAPFLYLAHLFLGSAAPHKPTIDFWEATLVSALAGGLLSPLGLFGGWLLWRIGVRPAPMSVPAAELAPVFD
ncbi:MAG TPA: hypothetical protein VGM59_00755 [Dongiaceae bacterium]|jgi:hypothetical protein